MNITQFGLSAVANKTSGLDAGSVISAGNFRPQVTHVMTEGGDFITTEAGDRIVAE